MHALVMRVMEMLIACVKFDMIKSERQICLCPALAHEVPPVAMSGISNVAAGRAVAAAAGAGIR